jgi:hypothetical protein
MIKRLINELSGGDGQVVTISLDDAADAINALKYLDNSLSNRRGYQRKNQIKRKLMWKMAEEHGLMQEIDDAARAQLGEDFDALGEDDIA